MTRKSILLGGAIGIVSLASVATASASFGGNSEVREAVKSAIENKDYSAFQTAAADTKIIDKITSEESFSKLIEAKELKEAGDIEGAKAIRDELGLKGHKRGGHNPEARDAVKSADYDAFVTATDGKKIAEKIDSQEKFTLLVEANELRAAGDREGARAILDELGIKKHGKHVKGDRDNDQNHDNE